MNIGNLYKVKKWSWLLFTTKETALFAAPTPIQAAARSPENPLLAAANWSRHYKCEVVCFPPDSIVVFLEEDEKFKKVLTSDGLVGWTWFTKNYNDCFEEVKTEE